MNRHLAALRARSTKWFLLIVPAIVLPAGRLQAAVNLDIVTFGDSTTAPREVDGYWLRTYSDVLRDELPYRGITGTVTNKGVRGDMTTDAVARFQTDVLNLDPDLVVMQFGINDAWTFGGTRPPRVSLQTYESNLRYMIGALLGRDSRVVLMTPNSLYPIDKNPVMDDYCDVAREIAIDYADDPGFAFIDMQQCFLDYHAAPDQTMQHLLLSCGVHPSNRGHRFVADHITEAIGAGPVPFEPTDDLAVWLKADDAGAAVGGPVASWVDRASTVAGANNAEQTTSSKQPTLVADASPAGDRPVLRFDGDDYLDIASNTVFESETISYFVVYKAPCASSSTQRVFEAEDASPGNGFWGVSAYATDASTRNHAVYARDAAGSYKAAVSDEAPLDEFVIVSGVINASEGAAGSSEAASLSGHFAKAEMPGGPTENVDGLAQGNEGLRIGARAVEEALFLTGDIAEILIYDSALDDARRGAVEQYLWEKWFQAEPLPGDLDGDGFVGGDDLDLVRSHWGQAVPDGCPASGDASGDGFVGGDDLDVIRAHWGQGAPAPVGAVPEPAWITLFLGGIITWLFYRAGGKRVITVHKPGTVPCKRLQHLLAALLLVSVLPLGALAETPSVAPLTTGPGNDSEAAWSPDGRTIAFQSDRDGTLDVFLLDVATGRVRPLVAGPGHACFPAWSPDGSTIAYAYAHFTKTAFEGLENGYNLFVVPAEGGEPRRLTEGLHRDYCPTFSHDGRWIYYSSNQGVRYRQNQVNLRVVPVEGGKPRVVLANEGRGMASVQPTLSPDGKMVAFGLVAGFRGIWGLRLARLDRPDYSIALSSPLGAFYGPRWSPKGTLLACTGYRDGDDGWGVYLVDARTGLKQRVATGPGNSRSPAWSPDGRHLVFENNRAGSYKLYRIRVPKFTAAAGPSVASPSVNLDDAVLHYDFKKKPGKVVEDQSPLGNNGRVHGNVVWKDGAVSFPGKDSYIAVRRPKGFDFGTGPFSVWAVVRLPEYGDKCYICVGEDPRQRLGWQLSVDQIDYLRFNARDPEGRYCAAVSDVRIPKGVVVEVVGIRESTGHARLYVDGALQQRSCGGALFSYQKPNEVRIGRQITGDGGFFGSIHGITVYRRVLQPEELHRSLLKRFWKNEGE